MMQPAAGHAAGTSAGGTAVAGAASGDPGPVVSKVALPDNTPGNTVWGGAHGIRILPDGTLEGGADPRREGAVRGW